MKIVTSWMEEGIKQGRMEGLLEGRSEGRLEGCEETTRKTVSMLLDRKLGMLPPTTLERLNTLSLTDYQKLTLDLLDFQQLEDLTDWLQRNVS